jgi:hypothetical protein
MDRIAELWVQASTLIFTLFAGAIVANELSRRFGVPNEKCGEFMVVGGLFGAVFGEIAALILFGD